MLATSTSSVVAFAFAIVVLGAAALRLADKPLQVRLAVGPHDAVDTQFAEALERELPSGFESSRIKIVRAESLADAADAVDSRRAELGIVRTDVALPKKAGTILIVHRDAAVFLARDAAKITEFEGLDGKKLGIIPDTHANATLLDTLLGHYGMSAESVRRVPVTVDSVGPALAKKEIDAVMVVAPIGSEVLSNVVATMEHEKKPAVFLPIDIGEALEQGQFGLTKLDIPKGSFPGSPPQPEDGVSTVAVDYQLVARLDLSEAAVGLLTRSILSLRRAIAEHAPIANFMQAPETEKGSRYPLHVGATAFYEDNEKSFMDRYGDWFYIAAMVAGGLGSAVASLITSLQARSRRRALVILDQLTDLRRRAADSSDQSALRTIDREVSELALAALSRAREGRFDRAGLDTLRLAIDETRRSITRRLAELRSGGPAAMPAGQP